MAKIIKRPKRTQAVIDFVDANYKKMPMSQIANHLGVSKSLVRDCMRDKGYPTNLFKDATTFKKGQTPFNKGMKMNPHPNSVATQFKKGCSINIKPIGTIHLRNTKQGPLKYIKVDVHKWILLSKYNWEKQNGEIPKGQILFHKDGNSQNCDISNLELITRKDLGIRNSGAINLSDAFVLRTITRYNLS